MPSIPSNRTMTNNPWVGSISCAASTRGSRNLLEIQVRIDDRVPALRLGDLWGAPMPPFGGPRAPRHGSGDDQLRVQEHAVRFHGPARKRRGARERREANAEHDPAGVHRNPWRYRPRNGLRPHDGGVVRPGDGVHTAIHRGRCVKIAREAPGRAGRLRHHGGARAEHQPPPPGFGRRQTHPPVSRLRPIVGRRRRPIMPVGDVPRRIT